MMTEQSLWKSTIRMMAREVAARVLDRSRSGSLAARLELEAALKDAASELECEVHEIFNRLKESD